MEGQNGNVPLERSVGFSHPTFKNYWNCDLLVTTLQIRLKTSKPLWVIVFSSCPVSDLLELCPLGVCTCLLRNSLNL